MSAYNVQECETYLGLTEWVRDNLPTGSLHVNESGEVIIHTGLELAMNGELEPIRATCPTEGDIPLEFCTCGVSA